MQPTSFQFDLPYRQTLTGKRTHDTYSLQFYSYTAQEMVTNDVFL